MFNNKIFDPLLEELDDLSPSQLKQLFKDPKDEYGCSFIP